MKTKTVMTAMLSLCMMAFGTQAMAQKNAESTVRLRADVTCNSCKSKIEKNIGYEKGVTAVDADIEHDVVTVTYKPAKTSPEAISAALSKLGYDNQLEGTAAWDSVKHDHKACDK